MKTMQWFHMVKRMVQGMSIYCWVCNGEFGKNGVVEAENWTPEKDKQICEECMVEAENGIQCRREFLIDREEN